MAIVQISRIQHRRGLQQDLPQLSSGELGWSIDQRRLYIGNGTTDEGAPTLGRTEILTEQSVVEFSSNIVILQGNVVALESNVAILQGNIADIERVYTAELTAVSTNTISSITSNNAVINYTLSQGTTQRIGTLRLARFGTAVSYDDVFSQNSATDLVLTVQANATHADIWANTTTATSMLYQINILD
jgi:hypothetical protein